MRKQIKITIPFAELVALLSDACQAPIDENAEIRFENGELVIDCEMEARF